MYVKFHIKSDIPKRGVLVTGFHGLGVTGYIAVKHMIASLNAERIGFIETKHLPPFVFMDGERIATPFEIYRYDKFIFILTESPPASKEVNPFSKAIAKWTIEQGFSEAVLIGGLDSRLRQDESDKIRFAATKAYMPKLRKYDFKLLEKGWYIVGPLAVILTYFEIHDFPAVTMLPYADPTRPDPRAAAIAVDYINKIYGLNIDNSKLYKDAEKIEEEIAESMRRRKIEEQGGRQALYI